MIIFSFDFFRYSVPYKQVIKKLLLLQAPRTCWMDINDIYELIPDFHCTEGCHDCCQNFGVPSRTRVEDERVKAFLRKNSMQLGEAQGNTCPYLNETGCSIYPVRPLICRLYGTSPSYRCKMEVMPIRFLHEDEEEEILHLYRTHFF